MTRNKLSWLVAVMGVSLIGLVIFQVSWVDDIISSTHQSFEIQVQDALQSVATKLEKKEAIAVTVDNFHADFIYKGLTKIDSTKVELIESSFEKKVVEIQDFMKSDLDAEWSSYYFSADTSDGLKNVAVRISDDIQPDDGNQLYVNGKTSVILKNTPDYEDKLKQITKKSEYVQLALHDLFSGSKKLSDRIDGQELDSLISSSLQERGINITYEYGVVDPLYEDYIYSNSNNPIIKESNLKVSLFPNDVLDEVGFLHIIFPDQLTYIGSTVWKTLALSILFISIVVYSFGYAIHTIVRQKNLSEMKTDFINNMTHELKTPISTVSLACEALRDPDIQSTDSLKNRYLGIIQDENQRLSAQVEKVLQMAVIEKKDFELNKEEFNLHDIIESALDKVDLQLSSRSGKVSKNLNAIKCTITADLMHVTNIVSNLLDNAIKYSQGEPVISITTQDLSGGVSVEVKDHGIGISRDGLTRVFERFYRVHTGNLHDVKGFGLGLSYVKSMVEAHGGNIRVESELKKGSTFIVFFPYESNQIAIS
ncbi:MAG: HAMP domain-containing histidine kinase [Reichenbachiella sp.]